MEILKTMSEEEKDKEVDDTQEEETSDEKVEDTQSEETDEPITPEKAYGLAQALQKGYTITRQDIAEIRENMQTVQTALSDLNKRKEETGGYSEEDEPITVKKLLEMQNQDATRKQQETARIDKVIESQLADLKVQGKLKDTKEDTDKLLNYAVAHKITNLYDAVDRMEEIENARKEGRKEAAKGKVKEEAGSEVGTSKKTETKEQGGVSYDEIRNKDMTEIAQGE